ncbi:unnamed protein product, partial [Ilex paraguariensis]
MSVFGINLEEGLDVFSSQFKIFSLESFLNTINAIASLYDGVDAKKSVIDVGLSEINLVDFATDLIGKIAYGAKIGEQVVRISLDDLKELGGFVEVGELFVKIGALGENGVQFKIQGSLVGNAFMEEMSHGSYI